MMTRTDAITAFIAIYGTNSPGTFINLVDGMSGPNPSPVHDQDDAFSVLYADVHTDSDVDEIVDEIDDALGNDVE